MNDLDTIPVLDPDLLYVECPDCLGGRVQYCMTCWDEGLIVHACGEE